MWYVYDKATTVIQKTVKTGPAARAWITRKQKEFLANQGLYVSNDGPLFDWSIAHSDNFHKNIERRVEKTNLMTGEKFTQPANTPRSCDPSSELYWVM
jgi:hypothetical protein